MCEIKSAIMLKDRLYMPLDHDHHTQMLEELGIKDNKSSPNFVRLELSPIDSDIFNHNLDNWKLKVDQDFRPEWFCEFKAEEEFKKKIPEFFEKRFLVNDKTGQVRTNERLFISNSSVVARENSSVEAWENSSVVIPHSPEIKIKGVHGNATIKDLSGNKPIIYVSKKDLFEIKVL